MSKKLLRSRINELFNELAGENRPLQDAGPISQPVEAAPAAEETDPPQAGAFSAAQAKTGLVGNAMLAPSIEPAAQPAEAVQPEAVVFLPAPEDGGGLAGSFFEVQQAPLAQPALTGGFSLEDGAIAPASKVWTRAGKDSLAGDEIVIRPAEGNDPAAIAVPMHMQGLGDLLLEIVDENGEREWSEDDRQLVFEVSTQLALALDNAQLYHSVQQELAERIRAEQAILRRNNDLATLNQVGQQLNRLASRADIFNLLDRMIGEVLDNNNLTIFACSAGSNMLEFPVCKKEGLPVDLPARPLGMGLPDYLIRHRHPILITQDAAQVLKEHRIEFPDPLPASLLAIPIIAGDTSLGGIVLEDFQKKNAFDALHLELLQTAAAQVATAIENADLFQQMQIALEAIENRERYQSSIARAAAALTEAGSQSIGDVLALLGQASKSSRVFYATYQENERGQYWATASEWHDPAMASTFGGTHPSYLSFAEFPNWTRRLAQDGWMITHSDSDPSREGYFLKQQGVCTRLLLAVGGSSPDTPGLLAFDQPRLSNGTGRRDWQPDEISALRLAADALSNTIVREGLLGQVQSTLSETESLYRASNQMALAGTLQEMVEALVTGVRIPQINRAVLLLFEHDPAGKPAHARVEAGWQDDSGIFPAPAGSDFMQDRFEQLLLAPSPVYIDDILSAQLDAGIQQNMLEQQIGAAAVLPLWVGKRQIGALLLLSQAKYRFTSREKRTYPPLIDQLATAVEYQRLFNQTQAALAESEMLYRVSNRIAQAAEASDLLGLVVDTLLPSEVDRASLILVENGADGEPLELELIGLHQANSQFQALNVRLPITSFPLVKTLGDTPLVIPDIQQVSLDQYSRLAMEQLEAVSACIVPLRTSGSLVGMIVASSKTPASYTQDEIRLLSIAGNGIAVALDKRRLLRQAQRRALELQTASEIARDTASTLSLDLLLNRITNLLHDRFGFDLAGIYLLDESKTFAVIREAAGAAGDQMKLRGSQLAVGSRSVIGTVTSSGEPLVLNDVSQSSIFLPDPLLPGTRSEMTIPLKLGATIIGALDLQSSRVNSFTPDDATVLQILADQIAIAIENAQAYELSQKAIADMREIDRVKSQFLANMSHELRTPLNSIIGFSRVILKGIDGPVNDTQKQDLTAIYNSGQHLLSLINDILDLSKIEAGKMELAFSEVNIADLINSALSTATGLVKDKNIKLNTIIPDDLPTVQADNIRLRQVLINLLSNAAKFTESGSITIEAAENVLPGGARELVVMVTDTGPGIESKDQAKLFLPFSQVDDSPTRKTGGTGLGLSICRSLMDLHGGRIGLLRSELGAGSTFYFALPLGIFEPAVEASPGDDPSNTILAIDDDPKIISLYERYLKPHGYTVIPWSDPSRAVEKAREVTPFAITLDINMPGKDGWQVLNELKKDPGTRTIPVIVCSIQENQQKGFSMGAADYLVKPFLQEDMINAISRLNRNGAIQNILVIDDDPDDLRLLQKILETQPQFKILVAEGGPQGWHEIQTHRPDAIILDLFMPEMNGFKILENLRADLSLRHLPVLILTGADLTVEQHQQLTSFGQSVMAKGYLREKELLVLLEEALHKFNSPNNASLYNESTS